MTSLPMNGLVLRDETITQLRSVCEMLRHADTLRAHAIELPRVLLSGPPGTGKTQIARVIANESGYRFVSVSPTELRASYIGQGGSRLREAFERARASAPCILFLDDLEWSACARDSNQSDVVSNEIVIELLTQIDGVKKATGDIFILAATQNPAKVDPPVRLRFTMHIELQKPGLEERRRLIVQSLGAHRVDFDIDGTAEEIATLSEGMSGRDLTSVVRQAAQNDAERVENADTVDSFVLTRATLLRVLRQWSSSRSHA